MHGKKNTEEKKTKKEKTDFSVLKKLIPFLKKHAAMLALSILFAALTVLLQLYVPVLFGNAIDEIAGEGMVNFTSMGNYLVRILVLVGAAALFTWLMNLINNRVAFKVVEELRSSCIRRIEHLPLAYLDRHSTGDIVSRVITDTDVISDGLLLGFTQLFSGVLTVLFTIVFMLSKNVLISLIVMVLTPLSFLVARFISRRSYKLFRRQSEVRGEQTALIDEMITNAKVVKAFGYEERAKERFSSVNEELMGVSRMAIFYSSLTNPGTRCVNSLVYAAVALVGVLLIPGGTFTVGALSVMLTYANQYMKPFNDISSVVTELQNALACASRLFALLEEPEEVKEETGTIENVKGEVAFENVSFCYDQSRPLIQNLSLYAHPGMRVAIVGPTGCGKTTLINLLMRFYDTGEGDIVIDGKNIRSLSRHALRKSFGMVLQETWLKSGTVRENLAFGKPDATDEEILRAAEAAHCTEFIRQLPKGLDTVLTEESLSQGQKQLLCIARVILCRPPMLILDEATSSIDTRTELMIQQAFDALMQGRTSFVVAHRLSTVRDASLILVMRDGNIVEQGTHDELLRRGGFYSTLYNSQFETEGAASEA